MRKMFFKNKPEKKVFHLNRRVKTGLNIILRTVKAIYYNLKKEQRAIQQVSCSQTAKLEIWQVGAKRAGCDDFGNAWRFTTKQGPCSEFKIHNMFGEIVARVQIEL